MSYLPSISYDRLITNLSLASEADATVLNQVCTRHQGDQAQFFDTG